MQAHHPRRTYLKSRSGARQQFSKPRADARAERLESRFLLYSWTPLSNLAPAGISTMLLLGDGTVMAQRAGTTKDWYKLTPNAGNYVTGTWSSRASMSLERQYYASNVLKDGRVFLLGGEYSGPSGTQNWINSGEIYNPFTNSWSAIPNFPESNYGDVPSGMLPDGRVLCGSLDFATSYVYNPASNSWSNGPNKLNGDRSDEESWVKLSGDNSILSYNIFGSPQSAQRYVPASNTWVASGACPVQLHTSGGAELGPAFRFPDGRALFIGGTNHNAIYNPTTNNWTAIPDTPGGLGANDAPGAETPNGQILYCAGPTPSLVAPTSFFDYDPVGNTVTQLNGPTGTPTLNVQPFITRMLMLPTGQVLFTYSSNQLYVFNPDGGPQAAWKPTVTNIFSDGTNSFTLSGRQLNGISEGAAYGDDAEMSSNYPVVRNITNLGVISYASSHDWNNTGVGTGSSIVSTQYSMTLGFGPGARWVQVSGAGISSDSYLDVEGTTGNDLIVVDMSGGNISVTVNGANQVFSAGITAGIFVNGGNGNDIIRIENNVGIFNTVNAGAGDDFVDFSFAGRNLSNIIGQTYVFGNGGTDSIFMYDNANGFNDFYDITLLDVSRFGFGGMVYGADVENLTLTCGAGVNAVNVASTYFATNTFINNAGGADTVNVGDSSGVQDIGGFLQIQNNPSFSTVNVNDTGDFTGRTINHSTVSDGTFTYGYITGMAPAPIEYRYNDVSQVNLTAGGGQDILNIYQNEKPILVSNAADLDVVNIGYAVNGGRSITGSITVTNPPSFSTINVSDNGDSTGRTITMDNTGVTGSLVGIAPATISWRQVDVTHVNVTASSFQDTFNLLRTTEVTTYDGLSSMDLVNVGNGSNGVQSILAGVTLTNTLNFNVITVNDTGDVFSRNANHDTANLSRVPFGEISGLAPALIDYKYGDTDNITIIMGGNVDTLNILRDGVSMTIGNQGNADTVNVGNGTTGMQDIAGTIAITNPPSFSTVNLDDVADTTGRNIEHRLITVGGQLYGLVTGMAPGAVFYKVNDTFVLNMHAGSGADIVTATETAPSVPVYYYQSSGFDSISINPDATGFAQLLFPETIRLTAISAATGGTGIMVANGTHVLSTQSVALSGTGTIDLYDNDMILDYSGATQLATIETLIKAARNGGNWLGSGITSTSARLNGLANTSLGAIEATDYKSVYGGGATFDGETIDNNAVLVKYTYYGDTNFNGKVDGGDYARIDATFNQEAITGNIGGWFNGDFDYNAKVDGADYSLIDAAFNNQSGVL